MWLFIPPQGLDLPLLTTPNCTDVFVLFWVGTMAAETAHCVFKGWFTRSLSRINLNLLGPLESMLQQWLFGDCSHDKFIIKFWLRKQWFYAHSSKHLADGDLKQLNNLSLGPFLSNSPNKQTHPRWNVSINDCTLFTPFGGITLFI